MKTLSDESVPCQSVSSPENLFEVELRPDQTPSLPPSLTHMFILAAAKGICFCQWGCHTDKCVQNGYIEKMCRERPVLKHFSNPGLWHACTTNIARKTNYAAGRSSRSRVLGIQKQGSYVQPVGGSKRARMLAAPNRKHMVCIIFSTYEGFQFLNEPYQILSFRSFQYNFYGHIQIQRTILHIFQVWNCEIKGMYGRKNAICEANKRVAFLLPRQG